MRVGKEKVRMGHGEILKCMRVVSSRKMGSSCMEWNDGEAVQVYMDVGTILFRVHALGAGLP